MGVLVFRPLSWPRSVCWEFLLDLSDRQAAEAVRAALEEIAGAAPHLLVGVVDEQWGRRYGRPVRLGRNPTKPKTRITNAGTDAFQLLEHLHAHGTGHVFGPRVQTLRQIVVHNYYRDPAGRLRWRTDEEGGLPPSSRAIVSPYDPTARYARRDRPPAGPDSSPTSPKPVRLRAPT